MEQGTYLGWINLLVGLLLLLAALLDQMDRHIVDIFSQCETLQGEGETDTPCATRAPVAIQGHGGFFGGSLALSFALLVFADGLGSDLGHLRFGGDWNFAAFSTGRSSIRLRGWGHLVGLLGWLLNFDGDLALLLGVLSNWLGLGLFGGSILLLLVGNGLIRLLSNGLFRGSILLSGSDLLRLLNLLFGLLLAHLEI